MGGETMKRYRIMKIKEIIQKKVIETQEELAAALKEEGIVVTQATVSRDIKDLMLIKIPYKDGHYRYALSNEKQNVISKNHAAILFQEAIVKIDSTMNMVVLHTIPGSASSVAFALDHAQNESVVGTLAGDDTILIILRTLEDVPKFLNHLQGLLKT
jgi:transcriptional regulator of arginine metabolism